MAAAQNPRPTAKIGFKTQTAESKAGKVIRFGASPRHPLVSPLPPPQSPLPSALLRSTTRHRLDMLASPAALHLLLPAPSPHRHHLAFALPYPAPPLHAACSRRRAPRRHVGARASAAVEADAEATSSGPAKFSVRIPVGDREVSR